MVDQGVHLRVIQEIMGHSDVRVTERYTHIASVAVREPAGLMGAALLGNSAETATRNATNSPLGDLPKWKTGKSVAEPPPRIEPGTYALRVAGVSSIKCLPHVAGAVDVWRRP